MPAENDDAVNKAYVLAKIKEHKIDINLTLFFFDIGVEAYKCAQELFIKIDRKIHNEFAYSARAFASHIKCGGTDFLALADSFQAARHILNDSLDLVVGYAAKQTALMDEYCRETNIEDVYPDFETKKIAQKIKVAHKLISESRRERGTFRLDSYTSYLKSEDYKILVEYCNDIPEIFRKLKKKRREERWKSVLILVGLMIATPACLFALLNLYKLMSKTP